MNNIRSIRRGITNRALNEAQRKYVPESKNEDPRGVRRQKFRFSQRLRFLVHEFLDARGKLSDEDINGEASVVLFDWYNDKWRTLCDNFNKKPKQKFTLRYNAFEESVEHYLNIERDQIQKTKEDHRNNAFATWLRYEWRKFPWYTRWIVRIQAFFMSKDLVEYQKKIFFKNFYKEPLTL